jgi:translin
MGGVAGQSGITALSAGFDPASVTDPIREILDTRFRAREAAITKCRDVIRSSANAIRSLHRHEWEEATALRDRAGTLLAEINQSLVDHPDIFHAGFVHDAAKEYAEAAVCAALFRGEPLPTPEVLGVEPVSYLHGLGEAVGELRRRMLDCLRDEDLTTANRCLSEMDQIVDLLAQLDYPDGMTAGLRRTTDVARSLVERSRADLTTTVIQERLRKQLET